VRLPGAGVPFVCQQQGWLGGQRHLAYRPAAGFRVPSWSHILAFVFKLLCVMFQPKSKFIRHFVSPVFMSIEKGFWNVLGIKAFSRFFFQCQICYFILCHLKMWKLKAAIPALFSRFVYIFK
jgi:hypothetical protein